MYCAQILNVVEVFLADFLTFRSVKVKLIEAFVE
jgi:hypothetical protein